MNIEFEDNEFTSHELLDYLKRAYGSQINGAPFFAYNINNWIRIGKIPTAYGDHRILKVMITPEFNNYRVIMIEGLTRDILSDLGLLGFNLKSEKTPKTNRPRKQRTQFYFQTLKKLGKQSADIGLSYSSGNGLKVNDVASNIGQGWNLIAGGVISRMQVGEPDDQPAYAGSALYGIGSDQDLTKYPAGFLYADPDLNTLPPSAGCPYQLATYQIYGAKNVLYKQHNSVAKDKQPDYFSFQFNGKSGVFVLDTYNGDHGVSLGNSQIKITFIRDPSLTSQGIRTTITSFSIQDVDGMIYKFASHGLTKSLLTTFSNSDGTKQETQPKIKNNGVIPNHPLT